MIFRQLGNTGLKVSALCLGTMTFGASFYNVASVDQHNANEMVAKALEAGINFFDTADVYSYGESEEILGKAIKESDVTRSSVIIATKVRSAMSKAAMSGMDDVNNVGLSRQHIIAACDASLRRLGTDYIDLYQVHGWDVATPIEESLSTLNDLVRQGKVRYIGCSNWSTRHLAKALCISAMHNWERFVTLQAYYSLVGRDVEYELLPLCREEGMGLLPWSPLSGGFLSGKYHRNNPEPNGGRRVDSGFPPIDEERCFDAVEALDRVAKNKQATVAQIALAWLLAQSGVSSVIIGAKHISQLEDNLRGVDVELSYEEINLLSMITTPRALYPGWMIDQENEGR